MNQNLDLTLLGNIHLSRGIGQGQFRKERLLILSMSRITFLSALEKTSRIQIKDKEKAESGAGHDL